MKAAQGELTEEDMRLHIIPFLRGERKSAVQQAAKKRKAAVSQTKSAEDMLRELE